MERATRTVGDESLRAAGATRAHETLAHCNVREWREDEGWGVVWADDVPEDIWVWGSLRY